MEKHYSLYLDSVRFLAALFVVLSHYVRYDVLNETMSAYTPDFGREAVMIFFILSGYVIAYTTDIKKQTLIQYGIARMSRIYSVVIPLLILSFFSASLIHAFSHDDRWYYQLTQAYLYIPFHALFLGEIWNTVERPPLLTSYWSLGYEVWYYIFFASAYYFSGARRWIIAGVIFVFMGHKLWLLLPVWLSGVVLYKYQAHFSMGTMLARTGWLLTIASLCAFKYYGFDVYFRVLGNEIWPFHALNLGSADRYLSDYVVCIMVWMNFVCALHARLSLLLRFETGIRTVASYTFTLYLIHTLVLFSWEYVYDYNRESILDLLILSGSIALATYIVGMLTEKKRYRLTRFLEDMHQKTFGRFNWDIENPLTRKQRVN